MLEIKPPYRAAFTGLGLDTFEAIARFFLGEPLPRQTAVLVRPGVLEPPGGRRLDVFYKQYEYASPSWRFLGRPSKARREFHNYAVFAQLGIPCADPLAWGEQRDALGRLRRAFIITRAIPGARTLLEFGEATGPGRVMGRPPAADQPSARLLRRRLGEQLAALTRRIHDAHFHHRDLHWRNILVTAENPRAPRLWWIDCPRGGFHRWSPFPRRRRIKDLASLDKSGVRYCTAAERLAFVKAYLGKARLDAEVKAWARAVVRYRHRRWPEGQWGQVRMAVS